MRLPASGQLLPSVPGKIAAGTLLTTNTAALMAITYPGVREADQVIVTPTGNNWADITCQAYVDNTIANTIFVRVWTFGGGVTLAADLVAYVMVLPARK